MWNSYWHLSCPRKLHGGALLLLNLASKWCEKQNLLIKEHAPMGMGARREGALAHNPHGFRKRWRHMLLSCKTLKFSLAPSALAFNTLKFSLKHLKFAKVSTFCRRCAKNWQFCYSGLQIPFILSKTFIICKNFPFVNVDAQKLY